MDKNWVESLKVWSERKSGLLYSIYATSFVIYNWKFFYVLFISSEKSSSERIGEAMNEFVNRSFTPYSELYIFQFLLPLIFTLIVIYVIPILNQKAYEEFLKHLNIRLISKHKSETQLARGIEAEKRNQLESYASTEELQSMINDLLGQINTLQSQLSEDEKAMVSQGTVDSKWEVEYNNSEQLRMLVPKLGNIVYANNGYIYDADKGVDLLTTKEVQAADLNDLIEYDKNKHNISLSDKGKFMLRMSQNFNTK